MQLNPPWGDDDSIGPDPVWAAMKEHSKAKFNADRERFMNAAVESDDGGWTHHTQWHWSRHINGERLDYWPSRKKYQFRGRVMRGDVYQFIKGLTCNSPSTT